MNVSDVGTTWHPPQSSLREYCSGKIADPDLLQSVEDHVQECQVCLSIMQQFESDSLERQLQDLVIDSQLSGTPVQRYELLEEIGRGGSGVVYLARQAGLERKIALKMLLRGSLAGRTQLARFRRESASLARLSHPHVVQVYDTGELDGAPFLAMEYIEGPSLAERLSHGPLEANLAAKWLHCLADAVASAHQAGIYHRDLKPQNILLAPDRTSDRKQSNGSSRSGKSQPQNRFSSQPQIPPQESHVAHWFPKLVDFGLAQCHDITQFQTATGETLGTPAYMAPEAINGKADANGQHLLDIYGLGAVLYECLTGRPPFAGSSTWEILEAVAQREPAPIASLRGGVPRDLVTICARCMEKRPELRFLSARELAEDLNRYLNGEPILSRRITRLEMGWRWARRRPAVAAAFLLSSALIAVVPLSLLAQNRAVENERNMAREQYASTRVVLHEILQELNSDSADMVPEATRLAARQSKHAVDLFQRLLQVDDSPQSMIDLGNVLVLSASIDLTLGNLDSATQSLDQAESLFRRVGTGPEQEVESLEGLFQVSTKRAILLQSQKNWEAVDNQLSAAEGYLQSLEKLSPQSDQKKAVQRLSEKQWLFQTMGNASTLRQDFLVAKQHFESSLKALDSLRKLNHFGPEEQFTTAGIRINLASVQMQLQESEASEENYRSALAQMEAWAAKHAENSKWVENWSVGILNQSNLLMALDRQEDAFETLSQARVKVQKALVQDPGRSTLKSNLFMLTANRAMFCPFPERKIEVWRDAVADATDRGHLVFARQMLVRTLATSGQPQAAHSELLQISSEGLDDQQRFVQASCHALISKSCSKATSVSDSHNLEPLARQSADHAWELLQGLSTERLLDEVRIEHLKTTDEWDAVRDAVGQQAWEQLLASEGN